MKIKSNFIIFISILISILFLNKSIFALERIENKSLNRLKANKIYMSYGRSTVIIFPCNVVSFSDGPTNDIKGQLNERNSQMIEIWYSTQNPLPQELKAFCKEESYVFDIIPNQEIHQSIFEVSRSYKSRHSTWTSLESSDFKRLKTLSSSEKKSVLSEASKKEESQLNQSIQKNSLAQKNSSDDHVKTETPFLYEDKNKKRYKIIKVLSTSQNFNTKENE